MKRRSYRRRYRNHHTLKSVGSWLMLTLSWIIALPIASMAGHAVVQDVQATVTEQEQKTAAIQDAIPVFQQSEQRTGIKLDMQYTHALKSLRGVNPTILIYHTHTTEAYYPTERDPYRETSAWRTDDNTKNVVAVGEKLKEILEKTYGFCVIHDTTDHEPPKLATAYDRSLITMQKYHVKFPSIVLMIDLHRDAYQSAEGPADYITVNGTETARLMFVVGKGEKYTDKPYLETNYALAERITNHLLSIDSKLARPIRLKTGRYNQHVIPNSLLVEVGHNANTLEQALAAMPYLAESIAYAFSNRSNAAMWLPN